MLLLARAANTDPAELPTEILDPTATARRMRLDGKPADDDGFDPTNISEVTWAQWRASVVRHGLAPRVAGPFRPQPAERDPRDLEHPAGRYTELQPWPKSAA